MSEQQVLYGLSQGLCCFRLSGQLRHTEVDGLDELIQKRLLADLAVADGVVIDLTEAEFMDSTCIGLLAGIARKTLRQGLAKPSVLVADADIRQLLLSLRLELVFDLIEPAQSVPQQALSPVPGQTSQVPRHAETVLRAHEALAELSQDNRRQFTPVIELLREDLEKR